MQLRQLEAAVGELAVRLCMGGGEEKDQQAQMWGGTGGGGREGHSLAVSVRILRPKSPCGSPFCPFLVGILGSFRHTISCELHLPGGVSLPQSTGEVRGSTGQCLFHR